MDVNLWLSEARKRAGSQGLGELGVLSTKLPEHRHGAYVLDFDSAATVGQLLVWENGSVEIQVLDVASELPVMEESLADADSELLDSTLGRFVSSVLKNESARAGRNR